MVVRKKQKITKTQIIVLLAVAIIYAVGGLLIYFLFHPDKLVSLSDSRLKFCYDVMEYTAEIHPEMVLFDFQLKEGKDGTGKMTAEFKYAAEAVGEDEDWLALAHGILQTFTEYLEAHPEHPLVAEQYEIILLFPAITYTNIIEGQNQGLFFGDVTYAPATGILTAQEFLEQITSAGNFQVLHIIAGDQILAADTDCTGLSQIPSLKTVDIQVAELDEAVRAACSQWMQ